MSKYIIRLDDACPKMDLLKWNKMEELLEKYDIKPLVGVIPNCEDKMMDIYTFNDEFWDKVEKWRCNNWEIAMHGFNHVYSSNSGGINPVNNRSEFAGLDYETQLLKIKRGIKILKEHNIEPKVFFAPSHTFDQNTLLALKNGSSIRIISDTIAFNIYKKDDFCFVPQQSGRVRKLPFKLVTFCYHPNTMSDEDFLTLEKFIKENLKKFIVFPCGGTNRREKVIDRFLRRLYFWRRK